MRLSLTLLLLGLALAGYRFRLDSSLPHPSGHPSLTKSAKRGSGNRRVRMDEFLVTTQHDAADSNSVAEENSSPGPKGRHHFTVEEDLAMLREVVEKNPFGQRGQRGTQWELIEGQLNGMGYTCSMKSCQDRLARLMRTIASEDAMRRSICGHTITTHPEMAQLLEQIVALKAEGTSVDGIAAASAKAEPSPVRQTRKTTTVQQHNGLSGTDTAEVSVLKRTNGHPSRDDVLILPNHAKTPRLLSTSSSVSDEAEGLRLRRQELAMKREEIDLQKERNDLEKERLELERNRQEMERKRQEAETAERTQLLEMVRQQQQVLFELLTKRDTEVEADLL
ncbi:hypothetical protein BV898_16118 [Hypsibius exemplaris]|uniref:Myb/SANT-like DNA-binding domain-containing protein n=1 Tax=Hypsibius exemplaris TaxID=2072580 RepID=A0A9X6NEP5_HYPEX|nr:hypothetical protein BV898_16118 [Hypsibius exemplaris]